MGGRDFSTSEEMIFEIDFLDETSFQKQNMVFFGRRYPSAIESDFFEKHLTGGFAILVRMISIFAPYTGQVTFARSFIIL